MELISLFAHAEDLHQGGGGSGFEHIVTSAPVAIPLYLLAHLGLYLILREKHKTKLIPSLLAINLVLGLFTYELIPALSVIAITVGICLVLVFSFSLMASE